MKKLIKQLRLKNLFMIFMFLVISGFCKGQTEITLDAIADSWIYENAPFANYGTDEVLNIGKDTEGHVSYMLFKWDLSDLPECIEVTSAAIHLGQSSENTGDAISILERITEPWDETVVTWDNQPDVTGDYGTYIFNSPAGMKSIPATELVEAWLKYENEGVMFVASSESTGYQACNSKENAEGNPQLIITYIDGTNSSSPTSVDAYPNPINEGDSATLTVVGGSLGTGASWEWYKNFCGGLSHAGAGSSITVTPTQDVEYFVRAEGICNTTDCASVYVDLIMVDIDDKVQTEKINIFPNPVRSSLQLKTELPINGYVVIYNSLGQKIMEKEVNNNELKIDFSKEKNGMYFLNIYDMNYELISGKKILKY
ncbi:MAG: hypothetical protein C0595_00740 [Marinilabiliales bacterium]|nr:MAG: hypothetical protein C0595_00740 [Marinilabiliales bacterium]